eukprot:TRINITY_DN19271_c0_g1_i1.p1 TRINITY_DN19271_c0_g1~~TRINITY_DN19271_c0_g1_i1.p1  ORF type:complete len:328 (+),score=-73.44 TRINITY_DN19271_c0_g1_i1:35-1018(+)
MQRVKVAVTGAAGQIGYALLFRLASGQLFGRNVKVDLHLLERSTALPALAGVAMELEDCAFPTLGRVLVTQSLQEAMDGVNWAILVGSVPRKQGMERSDLLKINAGIFSEQGRAINAYAAQDVRVFVVGNPCNTNACIAMHHAPDMPKERFYAMTTLDENRARAQLAKRLAVPVDTVRNMIIWGNHSSTQYPNFYDATISGVSAIEKIADLPWLQGEFIQTIQQRGAAIIQARGASSAASAANAILGGICNLLQDTPEKESYSMATCSHGEYGVDPGLIFSFPCRTELGQVRIVSDLSLSPFSSEKIQASLEELRGEYAAVKQLGLL